jgi:Undecaprenyl-phosphate glucose phosphotransferase
LPKQGVDARRKAGHDALGTAGTILARDMTALEALSQYGTAQGGRVMNIMPKYLPTLASPSRWSVALGRRIVGIGSALADALVIVIVSCVTGAIYHQVFYDNPGELTDFAEVGLAAAVIFVVPGIIHGEYDLAHYLAFKPHVRRATTLWNITLLCLLMLGFLIKSTSGYSRGAIILFYASGLPAILLMRYAVVRTVVLGSRIGLVAAQRIFLIGRDEDINVFLRRYQPWDLGLQTVGTARFTPLPPDVTEATRRRMLEADLKRAIEAARALSPEAVFVVAPWSDVATIDRCVEELLTVPVEIHLGPERILDRFDKVRICNFGTMVTLQLTRAPLSAFEVLQKRIFDLIVATGALIVLAPALAAIALLIRLDSPGPVFFRQRRYGFNQQPFRIIKFRTMTTLDDGEVVRQVCRNDHRVTRIGRWLRRWNIDELPQLINVLRGEMSLVGPRPHALSHDREYEQRISLYARRHNVRPGITGWAQVNGLRGEIDTDEKLRRRVDCDLYYIDNWSMLLDLKILLYTVFSRRAYRNAV